VDLVGWRWVTIPSCILGLALVITATRAFPAGLQAGSTIRLRGLGIVAAVSGTGMSALAAAAARQWPLAAVLAGACALGSVAAARAMRAGGDLAELRGWWRDLAVRRSSLGATLQMVANGLVQVAVPSWLIVSGVLGAGGAAIVLMGMTLTMAAMGPITGRRSVDYPERLRRGLSGCAAGLVGLAIAADAGPWWLAIPALVVLGLGAGSLLSPSLTAFSDTVAGRSTVALSLFNLARLGSFGVGGLVGGAAVDAGRPGAAFLGVALACGAAALAASRARGAVGGGRAGARGRREAPQGAEGGTNDG
jgi:BCD family chlorophyll transporter-like MFS transporter